MKTTELERELLITYEELMVRKKALEKEVKSLASDWDKAMKTFAEYEQVCGAIHLAEQVLHIKPVDLPEEADGNQSC